LPSDPSPESHDSGERPRRFARASDRLARMLVIVPYLVEHPGTELADAARLFGVDEEALVGDLQVLFVSGLPPYSPGDLIDVDIQDGRVWIRMADYFARPLRLTRGEALSLYLRGTALMGTPGVAEAPALDAALEKLREGLGAEVLGAAERVETADGLRPAVGVLELLRHAASDRERVEIDYVAVSTGASSTRRIDPEELFSALGNWYVAAWDHRSDEERLFRADRVLAVRPTGERFSPRGLAGAGRPLYTASERDVQVRLLLAPQARWIAEYYPVDRVTERDGGAIETSLSARDADWAARLVLRVAPFAEVLDPPAVRERVRSLAEETRARYR
jgi:proteasome accessory factor C